MKKDRASIFGGDDELDVSSFTPKAATARKPITAEAMRAVADASKFPSREVKPDEQPAAAAEVGGGAAKRQPRRYRTGRTVQFNARTTQDTYDALYAIADRQGWKISETLEHALAALQRELAADPQL